METKINIISNSQGVELYNVLPNNSVCFGDYFPLKLWWRIFNALSLLKQQFFESTTWLKALIDFSVETMSTVPKYSRPYQRIGFSVSCPLPTTIFTCPACCFEWHASRRRKASGVLGSPYGVLLAHGQARNGLMPHLKQHGVCPVSSVHTKGSMADCTCMMKPAITLLYSHIYTPIIK